MGVERIGTWIPTLSLTGQLGDIGRHRSQSGMLLPTVLTGSSQPVTARGGPRVGCWHLACSSSLPYLSRLPTLLRTQDTDEQGHTALEGNQVLTREIYGGVHALCVPHPGGKGLGPKGLQVSGTRSKGTSARQLVRAQSSWGENRV